EGRDPSPPSLIQCPQCGAEGWLSVDQLLMAIRRGLSAPPAPAGRAAPGPGRSTEVQPLANGEMIPFAHHHARVPSGAQAHPDQAPPGESDSLAPVLGGEGWGEGGARPQSRSEPGRGTRVPLTPGPSPRGGEGRQIAPAAHSIEDPAWVAVAEWSDATVAGS